jgi:nitroimidazol reductase NimA-like FMN-containing flavoprotein (pyridoxamine 5'-phosphate oxidase superfamily)
MADTTTEKARAIIVKTIYITVATFSKNRKPWVTPLYTAYDENYNFFWFSGKNSQHSENVRANNEVAMVIFDSTAPEGTGEGVYMEALVFELEDEQEIAHAIGCLDKRSHSSPRDVFDFVDSSPLRVYKAIPQKVWMNIDEKMGSLVVDARIEVNLFGE